MSVRRTYSVARMAFSGTLRRSPSTAARYQSSELSPVRCTWASMKPGSSVASPRSMTRAPAGMGSPDPAAVIVPPVTTTTAFGTVESPRPSNMRAALRTTTSAPAGAGDGAWAPARVAAAVTSTASTPLRIASPPERAGMLHRDFGGRNQRGPDAGRAVALRRPRAADLLVRLSLAGPRAVPGGAGLLGRGHRRRAHGHAGGGRGLHRARRRPCQPTGAPARAHRLQPARQLRGRDAGRRRASVGAGRGRGAGDPEPERPGGGAVLAGGAGVAAGHGLARGADPRLRLVQRGRLRSRRARVAGRGRMAEGRGGDGHGRAGRLPRPAVVLRRERRRARARLPA